jgi:hypothetical protein
MTRFDWPGLTGDGKAINGQIEAPSERVAKQRLREQNVTVTRIIPEHESDSRDTFGPESLQARHASRQVLRFVRIQMPSRFLLAGLVLLTSAILGFFVFKIEDLGLDRGNDAVPYPNDVVAMGRLQVALKDVTPGKIMWNPPVSMVEGSEYTVEARVFFEPATRDVIAAWLGEGPIQISTDQLTQIIRVSLSSVPQTAFDVHQHSESEQIIPDLGYTRWIWTVAPQRAGDFQLLLNVANVITDDSGKDRLRVLPLQPRKVHVMVSSSHRINKFVRANLPLLLTSVAVPAIVALWAWIRKDRRRRTAGF